MKYNNIKMYTKFFIFTITCFIIFNKTTSQLLLPLDTYEDLNTSATTEICFGTPPQCFNAAIDFSSCLTWLPSKNNRDGSLKHYIKEDSNSMQPNNSNNFRYDYDIPKRTIHGEFVEDVFTIKSIKIKNLKVLLSDNTSEFPKINAQLGLCFHVNYENSYMGSFLDNLKIRKDHIITIIDKQMIIGEPPIGLINDPAHFGSCKWIAQDIKHTDNNNSKFECRINGMQFNKTYNKDKSIIFNYGRVRFDYGWKKSVVPISIMLHLEKHYFRDWIDNFECNFGFKGQRYTFTCVKSYYELLPIHFIIGTFEVKLQPEEFFVYDKVEGEYEFLLYAVDDNEEVFVFGENILNKFIVTLDRKEAMASFHSRNNIELIDNGDLEKPHISGDNKNTENPNEEKGKEKEKESWIGKLFKLIGILCILSWVAFACLIGWRYYNRKKKFKNQSYYYKATDDLYRAQAVIN